MLESWFQKKYHSPSNRNFEDNYLDVLLVEYYEDLFREHPNEQWRDENGEICFSSGGADPLYDMFEKKASKGEDIDLWEAFTPEQKDDILKRLEKAKSGRMNNMGGSFTPR